MDSTIARLAAQLTHDQKSAIRHDLKKADSSRKRLAPLDLTLLRRSFPVDRVSDQKLMAALSSNAVAQHVWQFWDQSISTTRYRLKFRGVFPDGISRATDMQHMEQRIVYLAMKMHTTGLGPRDIETHQVEALAWSTERLYKDSDALLDLWDDEVDMPTKFLACARIMITIYEDFESYHSTINDCKNFSYDLIGHAVSKSIASSEHRQAWERNFKIPESGKPGAPLPPPSIDETNEPDVEYVHNSASTWQIFEQYIILVQYKAKSAYFRELGEEFDWAELAKCVPGRTANDCIQFFNSSKGLFDKEGEPDVPYSDTSPAVSRTKHYKEPLRARVEELEKELEAMKLRAVERAEREVELEDEIKQLKADTAVEPVHKKAKKD